MEGKRQATTIAGYGGGSSPPQVSSANPTRGSGTTTDNSSSLDLLFGPRDSGYGSGSGSFGSIFPPPSVVLGRNSRTAQDSGNPTGSRKHGTQASQGCGKADGSGKIKGGGMYPQNETAEPCYLSSSIYYGGQENYSPRTSRTYESHQMFKKEDGDGEPSGINSDSASRGNWWQGSLYY
ncbi:hypothetical protein MLD38_011140 [Melastoma candidum]|uniref:Uncharacterized protein n=1 Tax=Melastoma candidum TaxID=119954 RepID=A0ACB9R689_9MYRT|nr:hypothetical protein MLD38_011140 [Melastoma candidum]